MNKSELFRLATNKNAIRREAGLPLLNIREEMAREEYAQKLKHYHAGFDQHKSVFDAIKIRILADKRARMGAGFGVTNMGMMAIGYEAMAEYNAYLASRGFPFPKPINPIVYGELKDLERSVEGDVQR